MGVPYANAVNHGQGGEAGAPASPGGKGTISTDTFAAFPSFKPEVFPAPGKTLSGAGEDKADKKTGASPKGALLIDSIMNRFHLGGGTEAERQKGANEGRYSPFLSFSPIGQVNALAELSKEMERIKKKEAGNFEIWIRTRLSPLSVLAIGAGSGFGYESPELRITMGLQYLF